MTFVGAGEFSLPEVKEFFLCSQVKSQNPAGRIVRGARICSIGKPRTRKGGGG
jgi:hypothetical protein